MPPAPESAVPFARCTEDIHRPNTQMRSVTDLRGERGSFQGYNDGKFFREEVTSDENPRSGEAHGVGAGELESQRSLNPCHADAALSAIRRDRLCQDVQGAQICVKEITGRLCQDVYRAPVCLARSQMVKNPSKDPKGWYHDYRQLTTHLGLPVTSPAHPHDLAVLAVLRDKSQP